MSGARVTVHMLVRNELNWIWFAVQSALGCDGTVLVWDTGSTDGTAELVEHLGHPRVKLRRCGPTSHSDLVALRNEMIQTTRTPWLALIDGDEVWPDDLWATADRAFGDPTCDTLVLPAHLPFPRLGYFHADPEPEPFHIAGRAGAWAARAFRVEGARWEGLFGDERLLGADGRCRTWGDHPRMHIIESSYWHMTLLPRSPVDSSTLWRHPKVIVDDPAVVKLASVPVELIPRILRGPRPAGVTDPFLHVSPALPPPYLPPPPC